MATKRFAQNWDAPGVYRDILVAIIEELKPSGAVIKKIVDDMSQRGYQFTYRGLEYAHVQHFCFLHLVSIHLGRPLRQCALFFPPSTARSLTLTFISTSSFKASPLFISSLFVWSSLHHLLSFYHLFSTVRLQTHVGRTERRGSAHCNVRDTLSQCRADPPKSRADYGDGLFILPAKLSGTCCICL